MEDNKLALPAGTRVLGHVGYAEAAARGKTKAKLVLVYDKLGLSSGETVDIDAKPDSFEASGTTKRDVAVTGAGALIGGLLGKLSGNTRRAWSSAAWWEPERPSARRGKRHGTAGRPEAHAADPAGREGAGEEGRA